MSRYGAMGVVVPAQGDRHSPPKRIHCGPITPTFGIRVLSGAIIKPMVRKGEPGLVFVAEGLVERRPEQQVVGCEQSSLIANVVPT